jgi:hypothetical protein
MKKLVGILMALGLVSHAVLAQVHSTPQPSQENNAAPTSGSSDTSSSTPRSGAGSDTPSGASSGASNSMPGSTVNGMHSEAGMELRQPPSPTARLKPVTHDDVTYLCGGVGEEEVAYMKNEAKDYDLMLTFAARDGSYLADVDVDIKDAKGNSVLQAACDSPILLVDLPRSGNYRVRAETAGYTLNQSVKVNTAKRKGKSLAAAVLSWPQQVAEIAPTGTTATGSSGAGSSTSDSGSNGTDGTSGTSGSTDKGMR